MSSAPFSSSAAASHRPAAYHAPAAASNAPPGTFQPGTKVQVGHHRVVIEKYLSEGGFAHVYLVRVPKSVDKTEVAVLKRVAVPDKDSLANMRTEVETMKKLKGHKHIVTYMDSHASQLKGGGYEVFLLMEFCSGGGLIDFMNTRLQHRLTEPEILKIFSDVSEGVATMHYLKPPLLHRDLKVENVLITSSGSSRIYKLCDFGSTAPPRPAATTAAEGRLIEDDVQKHTTLQYRSPEMIDVYRKQPIDEKSDIWALGVLLYKLCYYTTPFEEVGQMAILNASFKFPSYPAFSDRTKKLIASMLRENPLLRPNIYQVLREVCSMRHTELPIKDIYTNRSQSESRRNERLPSPESDASSPPVIGIQKALPVQTVQSIPDITPMRRGRPTGPTQHHASAKPSPSPLRGGGDPFAALDSQSVQVRSAAADELAARFPSLDEFSILHDRGTKFQFNPSSPVDPKEETLNKRVTEALADDAFALPPVTKVDSAPNIKPSSTMSSSTISRTASVKKPQPTAPQKAPARPIPTTTILQPEPQRPGMVSTGTMTSPAPSPAPQQYPEANKRPIYRFPPTESSSDHHHRTMSQPRAMDSARSSAPSLRPEYALPPRPSILDVNRSRSQTSGLTIPRSPASSRPSLEGQRPSTQDIGDPLGRSKSANARLRPTSVHVESNLDYLRDREQSRGRGSGQGNVMKILAPESDSELDDKNITSNVDFLRAIEGDDSTKKKDHRRSSSQSKHSKRSSLPSISLSNTKNILAGRFGDAFRRFESNTAPQEPRTPTDQLIDRNGNALTPIAGSEATGGTSDDEHAIDETQDLPPEVRRELERRRLSQEEKRVAQAAAEYRQRLAEQGDSGKGKGGITRASTIQNRVKTLLDDSKVQPSRTAEGYGRFTESGKALPARPSEDPNFKAPLISRKPIGKTTGNLPSDTSYAKARPMPIQDSGPLPASFVPSSSSAAPVALRTGSRPNAPPKPKALRTGGQYEAPISSAVKPAALTGKPLPNPADAGAPQGDDWEANFSKRYPSLSGLELVETEIGIGRNSSSRTRDV
ncbi:uncharacterized protein BDZ99DRAFT_431831 [Mytilinidion resinicola]|uniref:non-specific serine/threonine protein kinase n=1 Tax=Mytilinidion resinicola TaxID=574789 RepID=A0A6A6ZBD1_9PEZI|nr:uncharacterized protein BDZ99DRAFT_431831 [Mytilinidion resinicola]KAF2817614.1 hypothetical protein BDZ99DRAFT_431831 [Mytilinidion resinicola]